MNENKAFRPTITVVLAMSADGKIADAARSPALFGSPADKAHLEAQVALVDAVLGGAATLRSWGTAMRLLNPELLEQRALAGKPPQPIQIICSGSGQIDSQLPFFKQPLPRWLLTTHRGASSWELGQGWEQILTFETPQGTVDLKAALNYFATQGIDRLAVLGGGQLVGSLFLLDAIDDLWLTLCPLLIGGDRSPTPIDGLGLSFERAPRLQLLEVKQIEQELFLHYRVLKTVSSKLDQPR